MREKYFNWDAEKWILIIPGWDQKSTQKASGGTFVSLIAFISVWLLLCTFFHCFSVYNLQYHKPLAVALTLSNIKDAGT